MFIEKFKLDLIKGLAVAAGGMGGIVNAAVLGGAGALVVGGMRFKLNVNNTRNSRFNGCLSGSRKKTILSNCEIMICSKNPDPLYLVVVDLLIQEFLLL